MNLAPYSQGLGQVELGRLGRTPISHLFFPNIWQEENELLV